MHRYLRIVTSFQRVAHLAKRRVNATTFQTIGGETKNTREKVFDISEAKTTEV